MISQHKLAAVALLGVLLLWGALAAPATAQTAIDPLLAPPSVAGPVVVRIYRAPGVDLQPLYDRYDVWDHGLRDPVRTPYVLARLAPQEYAAVRAAGYVLQIDLMQTAQATRAVVIDPNQVSGIPGYPCYRTVEETYATLDDLAAQYPFLVELVTLGVSYDKLTPGGPAGYDMRGAVLTNQLATTPEPRPRLFIMAATHAREYVTAETATRFAEYLLRGYGRDPDITWLLDYFELHLVPQANPDGRKIAEATDIWWRKNNNPTNGTNCSNAFGSTYGIDLNRNMSFQWGLSSGSSANVCSALYRGPAPLSEPENVAIADYLLDIYTDRRGPGLDDPAPDDTEGVFLTIHSAGRWILPVWSFQTATTNPNTTQLNTLGRKIGYFTGYDVCGTNAPGCLGAASGTHDDFAYGELGVPGYTYEIGTSFHEACTTFEDTLYPDLEASLRYVFKATRRPYRAPAGPEVVAPTTVAGTATTVTVTQFSTFTLTATVDDTRYDSGSPTYGIEPTQVISAARYSVNAPSWITGTLLLPMAAADGAFDAEVEQVVATIDTTGWGTGRFTLFIEGQDADGNWGVPTAYFVEVQPDTPTPVALGMRPAVTLDAPGATTLLVAVGLLLLATLRLLRPATRRL